MRDGLKKLSCGSAATLLLALAACGDDGAVRGDAGGDIDAAGLDGGGIRDTGVSVDAPPAGDSSIDSGGTDAGPPPRGDVVVYFTLSGDDEVAAYAMDAETGALTEQQRFSVDRNPGALAVSPGPEALYVALRGTNSVGAYTIDPTSGMLSHVDDTVVGDNAVYLSVDATGATLLWASYGGDRVASHRLAADGSVMTARASDFGTRTNPHCIVLDPSNAFALVPNTNSDVIEQYLFDPATGELTRNASREVTVPGGTGPRHLVFHPTLDLVYVVNEHADSVTLFDFDATAGTISEIETLSTLPSGVGGGGNTCADIHVHPSGDFLYASNRGHDSIAIFTLDAEGRMTAAGHADTEPTPREFGLDPFGEYLFAAGQGSGNVASYRIEPGGSLTPLDVIAVGAAPLWVEAIELPGG
jgi:6-phosphogluconolactonase